MSTSVVLQGSPLLQRDVSLSISLTSAGARRALSQRAASDHPVPVFASVAALIDLRAASEQLLGEILTWGKRIRGSHVTCEELLRRHLFDAADFLPYVEGMLAERRRAWIGR